MRFQFVYITEGLTLMQQSRGGIGQSAANPIKKGCRNELQQPPDYIRITYCLRNCESSLRSFISPRAV